VRAFGVSNHTPWQVELLKRSVSEPLVINQVFLGLGHPNLIVEGFANSYFGDEWGGILGTLDYCRLHNMQVQAYAPLRGGLLNPPADATKDLKDAASVLAELASRKGSDPSAVALAWLLRHPAGIVPVIGSTNADHVVQNCSAARMTLTRDEWYTLLRSVAKIRTTVSI
jgi:predicted oxidoreductase